MTKEEAIEIIDFRCMDGQDIPLAILWDVVYGYITIEEAKERFEKL